MDTQTYPAIDLTECEREPICHLGSIQPHGYLLAVNENGQISHASENIGTYLSTSAGDALGRSLRDVLGPQADRLRDVAARLIPGQLHHEDWHGGPQPLTLWVHLRNTHCILEWEQFPTLEDRSDNAAASLAEDLAQIGKAANILRRTRLAAELVRRVSGFDRVMIYQFHPDWSGEVIAEVRHARAEPYLGLCYPASDIPPQARKLYTENPLRALVDVYATPLRILSHEAQPLDLTFSQLRPFSPYHVEYLKNMKVGASLSASLLSNGTLWGLIACHHDRRKALTPFGKRTIADIAKTLSAGIENAAAQAKRLASKRTLAAEKALQENVTDPKTALNLILFGPERLRNLVHGCGTAVWTANGALRMGDSPTLPELERYARRLLARSDDVITADSREDLIARFGFAPRNPALAAIVALIVSRNPALILFGFRLEAVHEIIWGGDIRQPVLRNEVTGSLSPRRSFAQYKQSILGKAAPWAEEDLANARAVLHVLRTVAPGPEQVSEVIDAGLAGFRSLATGDHPLHNSLLDAIGNGISLLFRSDSGDLTLRYANQSLLELSEPGAESDQLPTANELLEAIGLPAEFAATAESEPRQVVIPTLRDGFRHFEGFRHFLVEKKLAFEITDQQGTVSLSAMMFTDTTRAERAREAFEAAQEKAKYLTFLKGSFLANMSHEIRTPMNGILGMVQLLQNTPTDPRQRKYLDIIQRSGDIMLNIVNDILDISKIEAGRVEVEKTRFDLTAVVDSVIDVLRPRAQAKSIALSAVFDSPPPRYFAGDSFRLHQVLLNIAANAIKFTSVGRVLISVSRPDLTQKDHTHTQKLFPLVITVSDTGIGIPQEQLSQVFDKFHQADQSTTRKYGGTGLGLAISRELVELMGGTISLASTVGVGSTFTISLPLQPESDAAPARATEDLLAASSAQTTSTTARGAGRRILVAEDDATNQIVIEAMLASQGFEVDIAESGLLALERLQSRHYDLILMDIHMPDLDGYETTARIRASGGPHRNILIIALTASALKEDRQRCLDAGMDDYMSKPIQMRTLWEMLRKWRCLPEEHELAGRMS